jgi:protein farnesyltransferase subunit beta
MQLPHLGPTLTAFLSILLIGPSAYHLLNPDGFTRFFKACKAGNYFRMTIDGEIDLRAIYIVTIIAKLLHLDAELMEGIPESIVSFQTYEGGLSNKVGGEAHGGYTFCGVASLSLLGKLNELDIPRLTLWLNRRQCEVGGFNGRTNKLVDSCYSFWVGSIFSILNSYFQNQISHNGHLIYS